jgi:tetratricopeptide (TPR) repeat protein
VGDLVSFSIGPRRGLRRATSALTWLERGYALELGDPSAAIAAYRRAIAGRPDLADAHNNLGRLLHDQGDLAGAEACYRRAIARDPAIALYWFNLGVALDDRGAHGDAIAAYERAITIESALADAHFNLARLYEQVARSANDEIMLRRAVRHLAVYRHLLRAG